MNAWSIVAVWACLSVPVSLALGLLLARGERDRSATPAPAAVPTTTPVARPVA